MWTPTCCCIILTTLYGQVAFAQAFFVSGDSVFISAVTGEDLKRWKANGNVSLKYNPIEFSAFSAEVQSGSDHLTINGAIPALVNGLQRAYDDVRKHEEPRFRKVPLSDGTIAFEEERDVFVFVYNRDFDWRERRIGLRYNEDWPRQCGYYRDFIKKPDVVSDDWRYSREVIPLKASVTDPGIPIARGFGSTTRYGRVECSAADVVIFIVHKMCVKDVPMRRRWSSFYVVSQENCELYVYNRDGEVVPRLVHGDRQ